jgi:hypothetical protein
MKKFKRSNKNVEIDADFKTVEKMQKVYKKVVCRNFKQYLFMKVSKLCFFFTFCQ